MKSVLLPEPRGSLLTAWQEINWPLVILLTLIAGAGTATLYSVAGGSWSPWAFQHVMRFTVSLLALFVVGFVPLRYWLALAYPAYAVALGLLVLVPIIGEISMGAQRWIMVGPVQVQPSELMKVAMILALARYYHGLEFKRVSNPIFLAPPLAMIGLPVVLIFKQPDLGTALMLGASGVVVILLAGLSWRVTIVGMIAAFAGAVGAIKMGLLKAYQIDRLTAFMDPEADPLGSGYHLLQSKIALGSGGLSGKGFMQGTQSQLQFLPEKHTDFIFTIFGEEFGFIGTILLLSLYFAVFVTAINIAMRAKSHFGRLLASGLSISFLLYVLINTGMVMGLAPVVGVPLPLVSYGGTVMLTVMVGFGLVMSTWINRDQDTLRTASTIRSL